MAITGTSVINRVRTLLQDSGIPRFADTEMVLWLTDGQAEIVTLKPSAYTKETTHTLSAVARQVFAATDAHAVLSLHANNAGDAILECSRGALDAVLPGWAQETGDKVLNYMRDSRDPLVFWVYPCVSGASVTVMYSAVPPDVTALNANLALNDIYRSALVAYACYRCLAKEDEAAAAAKAAAYYQLFQQLVAGKAAAEAAAA